MTKYAMTISEWFKSLERKERKSILAACHILRKTDAYSRFLQDEPSIEKLYTEFLLRLEDEHTEAKKPKIT